jgi:hypothetical protein
LLFIVQCGLLSHTVGGMKRQRPADGPFLGANGQAKHAFLLLDLPRAERGIRTSLSYTLIKTAYLPLKAKHIMSHLARMQLLAQTGLRLF